VVIKRPAGSEAERLVADLVGGPQDRADAAAARLVVLGVRAVPHLVAALRAALPAPAAERVVAVLAQAPPTKNTLATLDAIIDGGQLPGARVALQGWVALLPSPDAGVAARALDRITAVSLDPARPAAVRETAIQALAALPGHESEPLLARLAEDPDASVAAAARRQTAARLGSTGGDVATDAESLRRFAATSADAALADLHRLVVSARDREAQAPLPDARAAWQAARAALHLALARRGSTVALYDLRELIAKATAPPPVAALAALTAIGDVTCVEAIADAFDRIDDSWTRDRLREAMAAIAGRAGPTRRHAAFTRLAARQHPLLEGLPLPRSRRRA
jgi:hypothetical protein